MNHAPVWQTIPAMASFICVGSLIGKAFIYGLRSGGWDIDWAAKFVDSLGAGVIFSLGIPEQASVKANGMSGSAHSI